MYELFEYAPEPLVLLDSDFKVVQYNMKAGDVFGEMISEGISIANLNLVESTNESIFKIKSYFDVSFENREVALGKDEDLNMVFLLSHKMTFFNDQEMHYLSFKNITDVASSKKLFEQLYDRLSVKTMELASTIAEKENAYKMLKDKDDEMLRQLNLAREVQDSIFTDMNATIDRYTFTSKMKPASIISGDIVTSYNVKNEYLDFLIADVTGHGVPSALITMMLKMSFQTRETEFKDSRDIVDHINSDMHAVLSVATLFMTMLYGRLYYKTGMLELINCGHPQPIILRNSGATTIPDIKGMMLGVIDTLDCGRATVQLNSGDAVVFFTDGILEAYPTDAKYNFYEQRFYEKVKSLTTEEKKDIPKVIFEDMYNFAGSEELPDDATVFCINVK